ncbi:MAG: peptide deformylase [Acidobacteria bacterium]|nr:peptide deformylase [Acidobacteriota bacterium]
MAVRSIVLYENNEAVLRRMSEPFPEGSKGTGGLVADLKDTLLHHLDGIGLAAPQIGVHRRAIMVRFGTGKRKNPDPPIGIINPVIVEAGRELADFDGCLSFPGLYAETVRPHFIRLQGIDECGNASEWTLDGFDAVLVHHEVDHLNGVLFIDRVFPPDRIYTETGARWVNPRTAPPA